MGGPHSPLGESGRGPTRRVVPRWSQRVASQQPPRREEATFPRTELFDGRDGIVGATRNEPAVRGHDGRECVAIPLDGRYHVFLQRRLSGILNLCLSLLLFITGVFYLRLCVTSAPVGPNYFLFHLNTYTLLRFGHSLHTNSQWQGN